MSSFDLPGFITAELIGAGTAVVVMGWLLGKSDIQGQDQGS